MKDQLSISVSFQYSFNIDLVGINGTRVLLGELKFLYIKRSSFSSSIKLLITISEALVTTSDKFLQAQ